MSGVWLATVLVHGWLVFEANLNPVTAPFNDVNLYGYWADQVLSGFGILGVNQPWVYPFLALGPILFAKWLGSSLGMMTGWLILACLLNVIALSALVDWGSASRAAFKSAGYYLAFIALLGPVAIGRIDLAAAFLAILGFVQVYHRRFRIAVVLFTLGAWVKIWPIAATLALVSSVKSKLSLVLAAVISAVSVLAFGAISGGNQNLISFLTMQGNRGLQIESVAATFWVWAAKFGAPGAGIYFDNQLVTNQVAGAFTSEVSSALGFVMVVALLITLWLSIRAFKAGANTQHLFVITFLTGTLDLIVFNKVGSPQFELWLAVPLMAGVLLGVPRWRLPLVSGLGIALATNLLYPIYYMDLMALGSLGVWLLTLRNLGLVLLLIWANLRLSRLAVV